MKTLSMNDIAVREHAKLVAEQKAVAGVEVEFKVVDGAGSVLLRTTDHSVALAFYRNSKRAVRIDSFAYDLM